jgi:dTDP-4-dehydrorhamnose reductase
MKVAIIGANGQLGTDLCQAYRNAGHRVWELNHDQMEVSDFAVCRERLSELRPDLILNCAADHNVELCEANPEHAFRVNALGARNLASLSNELDCAVIYFSTDYVFDGTKGSPYHEGDCPCPLNAYGNTKLAGEYFTRSNARRHFVCRSSALFGKAPCRAKGGLNFVQLMQKLARERGKVRVVNNEIVSPTYSLDLARQIEKLTATQHYGLYHVTSQGACSWYEFAAEIFRLTEIPVELSVAGSDEFPAKVPRPKYSVLENRALKDIGLDQMPHWKEALQEYLKS